MIDRQTGEFWSGELEESAVGVQLEVGVQVAARWGISTILARGPNQGRTRRRQHEAGKHPEAWGVRIVAQAPSGQIHFGVSGVEEFDPIFRIEVFVFQARKVFREDLPDDEFPVRQERCHRVGPTGSFKLLRLFTLGLDAGIGGPCQDSEPGSGRSKPKQVGSSSQTFDL